MNWRLATVEEVKKIIETDLAECDVEQAAAFRRHSVEPYLAPIVRYGKSENVVVVARRAVMYGEDVEESFNVSPISPDGTILEHWCNQDPLRVALNHWIERRERPTARLGPCNGPEADLLRIRAAIYKLPITNYKFSAGA